ncbi:MAG: hypothetical protein ACXU89_23650 [Xanthobacteraceae bacterium]
MPSIPQLLAVMMLLVAAAPASAEPSFEPRAICRTAIAAIMDRDPKLVQTTTAPDGVVLLTYVRPIDNFVWAYRCRLQDNRVIWANDPGRWREDVLDDKIFFEVAGAGTQLRIIENHVDGTSTRQVYDRSLIE